MSRPHELFCLGAPRLVSPAGVEVRLKARKHLALLVYLAVEPGRHRRDLLVDLLWPAVPPAAARQSLSTAVSVLRSKLGKDAVIGEPNTLRLTPGRVRLDLERLESGDVLGNDLVPPLEVDGFLEGFEIPDAPEFGLWRDRQHAHLLPAIKAALIRLADFARRTADVRRLSRSADRLLAIDDLAEEGIRARMEASALTGDRLTAIRVYDEWSDRLANELGATPSPLLEGMALRLRRRGWERPVSSPVPAVRTEQWRDRPFIGRKREYRVLYETWEGVAQGSPRHVLIVGDSGVGKTTLADRLATAIGLEGATVSRVRCFELERGIPYAAIGGTLASLLDRPGAAATSPEALAELGRIIPEVRYRYASLPAPLETQGESARIRFAEAALEFLTALMEEHPVVLIVDDFQLADEASLAVLHLLMRRIEDRPLMVIMASREELPEGAVHGARIRDGANYLGVTELELGPMPADESETLLDALIQQSTSRPTATERRALLAAAGGYPMALELMFRDWEEHGTDSLALSLGAMTADVATNLDHTYRRLAASLDRALDPTTRTVLHLAAVLDRRLNEFEMYGLVDVSMGQTMTALADLVSRHTLRDTGVGLEFVNPALRANAYLSIPTPLRRVLHHQVSERLLERHRSGEVIPGLEIAWHCVRGGRLDEASPHLLRGAQEALLGGAPHEAELALRSGKSLLRGPEQDIGAVLLAQVLQDLGRWTESLEVLYPLQDLPFDLNARARLLLATGRHRTGQLSVGDQVEVVKDLTSLGNVSSLPVETRVGLCFAAASIAGKLNNTELLISLLNALDTAPVASEPEEIRAKALLARAAVLWHLRDYATCQRCLDIADAWLSVRYPNSPILANVRTGRGALAVGHGDYDGARAHFLRGYEIAAKLDNETLLIQASANVALTELEMGAYTEAVTWADRCLSAINAAYYPEYHLQAVYVCALAHAIIGNRSRALDVLESNSAVLQGYGLPWLDRVWALQCADIFHLLGKEREALERAASGVTGSWDELKTRKYAGLFARWTVRILLPAGRRTEAAASLASAWQYASSFDKQDLLELLAASAQLPELRTWIEPFIDSARCCLQRVTPAYLGRLNRLGFEVVPLGPRLLAPPGL